MYITQINNTYYYYRKTPKLLQQLLNTTKIKRSLNSSSKIEAKYQASEYTTIINKALMACKINLDTDMIVSILKPLLSSNEKTQLAQPTIEKVKLKVNSKIIDAYLDSLNISQNKISSYKTRLETFNVILNNRDISPVVIDAVIKTLRHSVPKRTHPKYHNVPLKELIRKKYSSDVLLSTETLNVYIVLFKAFLKWGFSREHLTKDYSELVTKIKETKAGATAKSKTIVLQEDVIDKVLTMVNPRESIFLKALRYSGLRPMELLQSKIQEVEGILCFDLTVEGIQLKNTNSRRVVPVSSKLYSDIEALKVVLAKYKNTKVISRNTTKALRELKQPTTATLYSLRHTFITNLINLGADNNIVSSLVGHSLSGNTQTMSRYFKGYEISKLQKAIELL